MMHLKNIWILNRAGLVLFQQALLFKMDKQSVGFFVSAIYSFARQIYAKGVGGFEVEGMNYFAKIEKDLLFVASTPVSEDKIEANAEFEQIIPLFFNSFPEKKIKNWTGDITAFKEFGKIIESAFKLS